MPTRHKHAIITEIGIRIVIKLQQAGHIAYFAGGWVRDKLLHHPADDLDIATSASIEELQQLFAHTIPVGVQFGILIVIEEQHTFEIATFRKESIYTDGRRPLYVEQTCAEEDAFRRDFTINGMFFDPISKTLLDFVGGEQDLKQGIIRAIGNPLERFTEDRLRMIRAVRYATRFGFAIEQATKEAILAKASSLFPSVAIERIYQEFQKMGDQLSHAFALLYELQLLQEIFPLMRSWTKEELMARLHAWPSFPPHTSCILKLSCLFPEHTLQDNLALCHFFKGSNQDKSALEFLHRTKKLIDNPHTDLWSWAHFYAYFDHERYLHITKETLAPHIQRRKLLQTHIERLQQKTPLLSAQDFIKQGITPGPKMGILLQEAERLAINHLIEDKHQLLSLIKQSILWSS